MPSVTRRRRQDPDRRASVEGQILAATERLLAEGTRFTDLGVQRIATEAGVARSTFYQYFRDKTHLIQELANTMKTTSFGLVGLWDPAVPRPEGGLEGMERTFVGVIGLYRQYENVLTAVHEVATYDETVRGFYDSLLEPFIERTRSILLIEQQAGRCPADLDIANAALLIVIGGDRFMANHVARNRDPGTDPAAAREMASMWWYGAYRRPAAAQPSR